MITSHTIHSMHPIFSIHLLKHSLIYIEYLIAIHFFAFICAAMVLPVALHVIVLFYLIISFLFFLGRDQKIISVQYTRETEWILYSHDNQVLRMQLLPSSVMMRYFLILHFTNENASDKKTLVLLSDLFSPENYRDLRRCVKMGFL